MFKIINKSEEIKFSNIKAGETFIMQSNAQKGIFIKRSKNTAVYIEEFGCSIAIMCASDLCTMVRGLNFKEVLIEV